MAIDTTVQAPCLCGAATVGAWTAGVHHGARRCARVVTRIPPALRPHPPTREELEDLFRP